MSRRRRVFIVPNDTIGAEPLRPNAGGPTAEAQRHTADEARIAAESARNEAELERQSAEAARLAAEDSRIAAERLRDEALAAVRATSDTLVTAREHMKAAKTTRTRKRAAAATFAWTDVATQRLKHAPAMVSLPRAIRPRASCSSVVITAVQSCSGYASSSSP
jgi:hypothetical protein